MKAWLITALMLAATLAWAQQETETAADPEPAEETTESPGDDASPDVFIPTEEISEDASVPFPVDI